MRFTILYYTILYYERLYCKIWYHNIWYITLYNIIFSYTRLFYTILYYTKLYYTKHYSTMLYCSVLHYTSNSQYNAIKSYIEESIINLIVWRTQVGSMLWCDETTLIIDVLTLRGSVCSPSLNDPKLPPATAGKSASLSKFFFFSSLSYNDRI